MKPIIILLSLLLGTAIHGQVVSYTMGLDVNCPSGLGE